MIVPQSRLLLWVAIIVLPFAVVAAAVPEAAVLAGLFIVAVVVLALLDAARAQASLDGIGLELPSVVRLAKDRAGAIEVQIKNEQQRAKQPARAEVRVYPNLLTERKGVAALFLNRGNFGAHAQRQVGKGRDFEKLREYVHGDGFDDIHWKATAKRGRPVTKVFQIERTQEVYVIIDASRLSARSMEVAAGRLQGEGSAAEDSRAAPQLSSFSFQPSTTTLERFITAALVLGLAAEQQGDLFGLLTFTDRVQKFVRARNGQAHYAACRDAIYALQPQIVTPDFEELCSFIRLRLRRRALLVFLTALDDPVLAESFARNLDLICRQHLILVNMLQPPGVRPLFSDPDVSSLDDVYRHLGGHALWQKLCELEKVLQRRGVRFSLLDNEKLGAQLVTQYLNVKQRQLL